MYLRRRYRKKDGKRHAYWAPVESYRTERGPRQREVAWLGAMDEQGRLGVKRCAERTTTHRGSLFRDAQPEWVEVDSKRVQVDRSRKFGGPWLGLELLRRLELDHFLDETSPEGREAISWPLIATAPVLGQLRDPPSELDLTERICPPLVVGCRKLGPARRIFIPPRPEPAIPDQAPETLLPDPARATRCGGSALRARRWVSV